MLKTLIEKLEKIEYKLIKLKNEGFLVECSPHEGWRSLTNMVDTLSSLVNRTTENKNYDDDIGLCHSKSDIPNDESTTPNLSSSEGFLNEVKNVVKSKPESDSDIHMYLSNFQELLGDLVFSICEINNCKMKLASGIKVKDLVVMKNLYLNFWELLSSLFHPNSSTRDDATKTQRKQNENRSTDVRSVVSDLVNAVESSLKEMSKVKLDIDHYIKFNLLEMQFNKPDEATELKSDVMEDKVTKNETARHFKAEDNDINRQNNCETFCLDFLENGYEQQPTLYKKPASQSGSQVETFCLDFPENGDKQRSTLNKMPASQLGSQVKTFCLDFPENGYEQRPTLYNMPTSQSRFRDESSSEGFPENGEIQRPTLNSMPASQSGSRGETFNVDFPENGDKQRPTLYDMPRENRIPRSGSRENRFPRSGSRENRIPRSGSRENRIPRSGSRENRIPRSGSRENRIPRSGSRENYLDSHLFPQNIGGGWDNCYDYKFVQDPYGNFFNGPIIYPPEVLFFEPPTVVFKSQVEPTRKHSLPKIYSVDSMNDDKPKEPNCGDINNSSEDKQQRQVSISVDCNAKKESVTNKLLFENTEEDLFCENQYGKGNEAEYVQLKEKISSLFTMLKTNQISDSDDIFDIKPLKIEEGDSSSFQKPKEKKIRKKKYVKGKHLNKNMTHQIQNENAEKQRPNVIRNKNKKSFIPNVLKKENYNGLLKQERLYMEYPIEFWAPSDNEVIYDRQSVIELFKSNPRECCNAESVPTQESNFCLWPVRAEYIYVSRGDGPDNCHSVPSGNSILLGKSFEKSFYSLQMNKKYEQKQLYDGDIIILDHTKTETFQNKLNSTYSLFNESSVAYNEHEAIENKDIKHLYPHNCAVRPDVRNNQKIYFNPLVPTEQGGIQAQQQTYAVHYADCADSFLVSKNYKKEKINFFNFNSYDESHNWDSFISIMTSKVGPNTHINEQRMFRKIVKNLGAESLRDNNLFGNEHTLTSSGGPFRLFDINGYPLTDSEGNVLKDPYGKCLVQLDSTGFPKDDVKVFDAAGNSPKDVKFDPTQKPQTNCVVVKLTDNFKRPLRLFDKYGRPLTDSSGKLLVNIHGRPLLRFDNFGRPNTDYRGGPLYTDNGFRWSFKTQSLSREQVSNETLTSNKGNLQNEPTRGSSVCTDMTDDRPKSCGDNCASDPTKVDNFAHVNSRNSDIWLQVESVLQQHSKKIKIEARPSETKVVVNQVAVNPNPEEKQYLNSIIYHDDGAREYRYYSGRNNYQKEESNTEHSDHNVKDIKINNGNNLCLDTKINCGTKMDILHANMNENIPTPFYDNIKRNTSKYFADTKFQQEQDHHMPNIFFTKNNVCKEPQLLVEENVLRNNRLMNMSLSHPTGITNIVPSIFNFKNNEYLNSLCNQILKNKMESGVKLNDINYKSPQLHPVFGGRRENFTETLSDFTSSFVSKYTNDMPLYTDSPAVSVESHKKDPQIMKILEDINSKFRKYDIMKNISNQKKGLRDQSDVQVNLDNKNKGKSIFQKANKIKNRRYEEHPKEICKSSGTSEETNTYIDIVNNDINQYQINVKERMRTGFQTQGDDNVICTDSNCVTNDTDDLERVNDIIKHNISEKHQIPHPINIPIGVYHGEYCRHFKNEKDKIKDSPFRFPSEGRMGTTIAMNSKVDFVDGKNWLGQDRNQTNQKYEKGAHKEFIINHKHAATNHEHFYPTFVKKPQRSGRDCNIVSFLGSPVKYVLNKLDTKLSSRQDGKEKKHKHLKTIHESNENEKKVKTLYSKGNKKYVASTETNTENKRGQIHSKKRGHLMAFKSKSSSEIQDSKVGNMSYSGSQDTSDKYSPESSSQYNKCSSDTVVMSNHKHTYPQRKSRRYEVKKPKKEQYSFETHYVHTSNTTNHHHRRSDKSPKSYNKHTSKSPKNKTPTVKLFKKSGHSGKQKRVR